MINQGTKFYSILHEKCPRCQEGDLFTAPWYNVRNFASMPELCPHCGLRYAHEPSFFFGAMFISYAFQVALLVATYVVLSVFHVDTWVYFATFLGATLLTIPISFRSSRSIWINIFVSYDRRAESVK